jgi:hypothetical protein
MYLHTHILAYKVPSEGDSNPRVAVYGRTRSTEEGGTNTGVEASAEYRVIIIVTCIYIHCI